MQAADLVEDERSGVTDAAPSLESDFFKPPLQSGYRTSAEVLPFWSAGVRSRRLQKPQLRMSLLRAGDPDASDNQGLASSSSSSCSGISPHHVLVYVESNAGRGITRPTKGTWEMNVGLPLIFR